MIKFQGKLDIQRILNLIDIEILSLNNSLELQETYQKQILVFLKNFAENVNIDDTNEKMSKAQDSLTDIDFNLKKVKFNISQIQMIIPKAEELKEFTKELTNRELRAKIKEYNKFYETEIKKVFVNNINIQNFIQEISFSPINTISIAEKNIYEFLNEDLANENIVENTLIISEMQNKVFLPYTMAELNNILDENPDTYSSIEEIIEKQFTKPYSYYKFAGFSRFKETYKLMIEREKTSKIAALEMALEMFSNYNLHPAIITACKNLNQLDIYLSCLEYDQLNDFHFFKIKFEFAPAVIKKFPFFLKKNKTNEIS